MFSNLEPAKRTRILNAAYKEFAEQGYDKASTNRIVKEAGIGKGMLFYYFNSKKELYHYLIKNGIDFIINDYLSLIDENVMDYIEKQKYAAQIKMQAYSENPYIFEFFGGIYINNDELPEILAQRLMEVRELAYSKVFMNIDTSLFRDDLPPELIMKLIRWTLDGYEKELVAGFKGKKLSSIDMDPYWDEFYEYLEVLKKIYYK